MKIEKSETVVVPKMFGMSPEEEARTQLALAAEALQKAGMDAHARGIHFVQQAVRLEMLTEGVEDDDIVRIRDLFVKEGLLEVAKAPDVTSPGGEA